MIGLEVTRAQPDPDVEVRNVKNAKKALSPGRVILSILAGLFLIGLAAWMVTNPRFEWSVVAAYLFAEPVLKGVVTTLLLTAACMALGSILGVVLALMKISDFLPFRALSTAFVWFFRAVPMLVQLIFWFNLSYLVPRIVVGVPFGAEFFSWRTNDLINALTAAVIGLTIHEAAYMSEIVRSGIQSVDSGQKDAARALGYKEHTIFLKFILPQAMRVIVPPMGSQIISLLKGTSLVSVIGMTDLLHAVQNIYSQTFEVVPLLLVASIWYLILVGILSYFQNLMENRLSRGYRPSTTAPAAKRLRKAELSERF